MEGKKDNAERNLEKSLIRVIAFVIFLAFVFFAAGKVFQEMNKVEYEGIEFTRENVGNTGLFKYSYYISGITGNIVNYNLYLKTDPRINEIEIEKGDEILFPKGKAAYVSATTSEVDDCQNSTAAIATLAGFLHGNQVLVRGASNNFFEANKGDYDYITCDNKPDRAVVEFVRGSDTRIDVNGLCYKITVGPQCDIWQAVEKFELETVIDGRNR